MAAGSSSGAPGTPCRHHAQLGACESRAKDELPSCLLYIVSHQKALLTACYVTVTTQSRRTAGLVFNQLGEDLVCLSIQILSACLKNVHLDHYGKETPLHTQDLPQGIGVYTINLESRYLLIQGVPALGVMKELVEQFALYGAIEEYHALDEYPAEQFTEVYLIKFKKLQCARVAKKKMDERSFFGSLLHVCYAPEFETVQETREKLQDRRKYIAKATNQRDCFILKKVQGPKKTSSKNSEQDCPWITSGSHVASNWDPSCFTSSPGVSHNIAYPSGNQDESLLTSPHYDNNCTEVPGYFGQNTSLSPSVHPGGHTPPASLMQQRMVPAYNGIDRFMPRTTHLQERKRKREEGNKFSLIGTSEDNTEVVIGPQLPEIPKVDMDDESLNTSATLIRNKLKEVADSVSTSVEKPESSSAKPLVKQRRRI